MTDISVANSPVLYLFTGKGDGSFNTPITNPQMAGITSMVVKDFNRDGLADMAVTVTGQNAVLVLIGKGDGTFLPPVSYATGNMTTLATALQSRGNDITDLAVLNSGDNTLGILLGNGDGTFLAQRGYPLTVPTESLATQIVVADVTGDGLQDVIARNTFDLSSPNAASQGSFSVLAGNGDGSFQPPIEYSSFPNYFFYATSLAVADFDRDGVADVAVHGSGYNISTLLSRLRSDPTFTLAASPSTLTIAAGKAGSATLTLTPQNGFNGAVQLTCTGLPANSTCSFAPATLAATGAPIATTLTITTNVAVARRQPPTPVFPSAAISFACLFGLLSLARLRSAGRRLDIQHLNLLVFTATCLFAATFFLGCNSGSNPSATTPPPVRQTPAGTSVVTITGLASGANGVSKVSQLSVTITQ